MERSQDVKKKKDKKKTGDKRQNKNVSLLSHHVQTVHTDITKMIGKDALSDK